MSAAPAVRPSVPAVAAVPAAPALAVANAGPSAEIGAADYSQITARLRQNIAYPYRARQQGMEGKVLVAFLLKADGSVADVRVEESSGHKLLDKDAVATVRKAAPFTSLGRDYVLKCPISYSLR